MRVSVITVAYNSDRTISDTINSVNSQTYDDIEHIIVDGLSTDQTVEYIRKYQTKRQKLIIESDKGIYDAMNKGINFASGDIIGILNSDDFFTDSHVVERIVDEFEKDNIDAVYGDIHYVHADNLSVCTRYYSSKMFCRSFMRMGFMPAHPSFYIKKSCYEKFGLYKIDYKVAADFELLFRYIFINNIKIKYLSFDFVTMRTGGISTSGWKVHWIVMKEHLRACRENKIYTNIFILSLRYVYKVLEVVKFKLL